MRSSGLRGNAANHIDGPVENGLSHKERLPTIQIDTVPSPPWSPVELSPVEDNQEEPLDEEHIDIHLEEEQTSESISEELRESLRTFVEEILSKAMVIAEKKLQFVGLEEEDEEEEEEAEAEHMEAEPAAPEPAASDGGEKEEEEVDEEEVRLAAEKVVEEVLAKATEAVSEQLERDISGMEFPELPSFQIDTVVSAPPSPDMVEEDLPTRPKKWTFKMDEDSESSKTDSALVEAKTAHLITFEDAPEDVKDAASILVKEIVGKAITMAEEKAVPTVPFNFEDVDLMKTSGPWYVRVREALLRVLRSACFCTPRRSDS